MTANFGQGDASYRAAGQDEGVRRVVDAFYEQMDRLPEAEGIRAMHGADLDSLREKLSVFLCGWLGGPKLYAKTFGPIRIPAAHAHLDIGVVERDAWLLCMQRAVDAQSWEPAFKAYFMSAIAVPAERVRQASEAT